MGDIGSQSAFLRFGRDIVLFTHIHLLCYCVVFLKPAKRRHNQRRHPEVISLLTTTILSLSLNSFLRRGPRTPTSHKGHFLGTVHLLGEKPYLLEITNTVPCMLVNVCACAYCLGT